MTTDPQVREFADWFATERVLTPRERCVLHVLALKFGAWVPARAVLRVLGRDSSDARVYDLGTFRTYIHRLRHKLAPTRWTIENRSHFGLYRLTTRDEASPC